MLEEDRLNKLVRRLDALADREEERLREEEEIAGHRREGAMELYAICSNLVRTVNNLAARVKLELSPPDYAADHFRDPEPNLFQINASGCIIQIAFEATAGPFSIEDYRKPYIIEGAVRWFNQESLEGLGISENYLFLCLEKGERSWEHFDAKTHRSGLFDEDYLTGLLEELLN